MLPFDPIQCRFLVAQGNRPSRGQFLPSRRGISLDVDNDWGYDSAFANVSSSLSRTRRDTGVSLRQLDIGPGSNYVWNIITFRDPAFLPTAAHEQHLWFGMAGSCVEAAWSIRADMWLKGTGWLQNGPPWDALFCDSNQCDVAFPSYSAFVNPLFCWVVFGVAGSTWTEYDSAIEVDSPTIRWTNYSWTDGVCSELLWPDWDYGAS